MSFQGYKGFFCFSGIITVSLIKDITSRFKMASVIQDIQSNEIQIPQKSTCISSYFLATFVCMQTGST